MKVAESFQQFIFVRYLHFMRYRRQCLSAQASLYRFCIIPCANGRRIHNIESISTYHTFEWLALQTTNIFSTRLCLFVVRRVLRTKDGRRLNAVPLSHSTYDTIVCSMYTGRR